MDAEPLGWTFAIRTASLAATPARHAIGVPPGESAIRSVRLMPPPRRSLPPAPGRSPSSGFLRWPATLFLLFVLGGCATLPCNYDRTASTAWDLPLDTSLGRALAAEVQTHPYLSGFSFLSSGTDSFAARVALADAAEHTLDLQYYLFQDDFTGRLILDRLVRAADRGVRVRILVDDLQTSGKDAAIIAYGAHPNIEVRLFNPFADRSFPWRTFNWIKEFRRLNQRMHNKMFVADNQVAVVGGRNIGDEYFSARRDVNFADLDLLAVGPVVQNLSESFDEYWNSRWAIPVEAFLKKPLDADALLSVREALARHRQKTRNSQYVRRVRESRLGERLLARNIPFVWAPCLIAYDHPEIRGGGGGADSDNAIKYSRLGRQVLPLGRAAQDEVLITSPYLIPGRDGIDIIRALRQQGVHVRILTNSFASTNIPLVHGGYSRYRKDLLELGVELYEIRPSLTDAPEEDRDLFGSTGLTLHAKAFIVDRRYVFVGSLNLDPRSFYVNTELGVVIDSAKLAGELADQFDTLVAPRTSYKVELEPNGRGLMWVTEEGGRQVQYHKDPKVGFWRGLKTMCLSVFAPESLL